MTAQADRARTRAAHAYIKARIPQLRAMRADWKTAAAAPDGLRGTCLHRVPRPDCEGCVLKADRADHIANIDAEIFVLELVKAGHLPIEEGLDFDDPAPNPQTALF